jgi:hypothetical protein
VRRAWLQRLVPVAWTGEQALLAVNLLRDAMDAIWAVHGEDMAAQISEWPRERWDRLMTLEGENTDDDDIPF